VRWGSFRAAISIGEQDRDRLHSAGARSLTGWMIWHSLASDTTVKDALFGRESALVLVFLPLSAQFSLAHFKSNNLVFIFKFYFIIPHTENIVL